MSADSCQFFRAKATSIFRLKKPVWSWDALPLDFASQIDAQNRPRLSRT
jgi:hypothetical protein